MERLKNKSHLLVADIGKRIIVERRDIGAVEAVDHPEGLAPACGDPDGPMMATNSPGSMRSDKSVSAWTV